MKCLNGISDRLCAVEKKLSALTPFDQIEKQISSFEKELKSILVAIDDRAEEGRRASD
jgi:DNA-binding TFAR19-related protein (PDSD5 family)